MTSNRDNFDRKTAIALSERAGHRCAFPGCSNSTIGPSNESEIATSRTGMACHIASAAAGPGARRYNPRMTSEERRSMDNGIWMCYTHGKLIDTDSDRYSVEALRKWRAIAELKAQLRQAQGEEVTVLPSMLRVIGLPSDRITIASLGEENALIGGLIDDARVAELWGENIAHSVRDECVELARNAFQHGGATQVVMTIQPEAIQIADDGADFDVWCLHGMQGESGGIIATKHLIDCLRDRLLVVASRANGWNETLLSYVDNPDNILNLTPCSIKLSWNELKKREMPYELPSICRSLCVVLPPYMSISDAIRLKDDLVIQIDDSIPIVFVLSKTSPKAIEALEQTFPGCLTIMT